MRRIAHLSDLHFGKIDPRTLDPLVEAVHALAPDVVAISGDLTQRARREQFRKVRAYLLRLPLPQVVVPGNHDIPFYDVVTRFLRPLSRFRRFISADLAPAYADEEIAVVGINTARSRTFKSGRVNVRQVETAVGRLTESGARVRMVVTHHPFELPEGHSSRDLVGRAAMAMRRLADARVDVLLAGHLHVSHTLATSGRYRILGHSALVVAAGSATSTRLREAEKNSFNLLTVNGSRVIVERYVFDGRAFRPGPSERFARRDGEWERETE